MPVEVRGVKELTRSLRKAGVDMKDLAAANQRVGSLVSTEAKHWAPHRTGKLANSIKPTKRRGGVFVRAGGARARYARYVEYGTNKMSARPFLHPALDHQRPEVLKAYEHEINQLLAQVEGV